MTKKYDYLIVGAGLFGATFANLAKNDGKKVLVIEKRNHIAGNIYTEMQKGINVHKYGAHIFHTDYKDVWDFVNQFAEFNRYTNSPIAVKDGKIYNMPFNMNTFAKIWDNVITPEDALRHINEERKEITGEPKNLEEQAISLVGRTIYELLIKDYTEKQWHRPCSELPADIIKRLPVRLTYDNNYFNDRYQGIPIGGYTKMVEKILDGIEVHLNTDFFKNPEYYKSLTEKIVYTGPLDEYFNYQLGELEWRSLKFEDKVLDEENHQGVAVVNYTGHDFPYTRSIEHKHFEDTKTSKTIVTYEYPADYKNGMEKYYTVNDTKNESLANQYKELAKNEKNVVFGGRLAEYKYYDMDDVIKSAFETYGKEKTPFKSVKIIVATHKQYAMPKDKIYLPLQVGAKGKENLDIGYARDDKGKNISDKNPYFCELTGLYWAINNLDFNYIGLVHYRRHFGHGKGFEEVLSSKEVNNLLERVDIILPQKRNYYIENLYDHYKHTMFVEPLDITGEIIKEKYPEYYPEFKKLHTRTSAHMFNMIIAKKDILKDYSDWLFDILFELEKRIDTKKYDDFHARFYGRISELLLDVYIDTKKLNYAEFPIIDIEGVNWAKKGTSFLLAKFTGKKYAKSF